MKINEYLSYENQVQKYNKKIDAEDFKSQLDNAIETKDDKKLMKQCREFESILVNMLFKQMRATIPENDLIDKSMARDVFEGMLDEEISQSASKNNSIGLAKMLYEQLSKKANNQE